MSAAIVKRPEGPHDLIGPKITSPQHARWYLTEHEGCSMIRPCVVRAAAFAYLKEHGHDHWPHCDGCRITIFYTPPGTSRRPKSSRRSLVG